jgi:hypothetical protein
MNNSLPPEILEVRAAEQRRELHGTVEELRGIVRQRLDVKANAREHLAPAAGIMALVGLGIGYGVTGMFYPRSRTAGL